jgi:MFS family permease
MLENYAFLVMFTLQILTMSLLHPAWVVRYTRMQTTSVPTERLAQLYPDVDIDRARERFVTLYRAVNTVIAVVGLGLLFWMFSHVRATGWDDIAAFYFMLQVLPVCLAAVLGIKYSKMLKRAVLEPRRTAVLERRRLFDFVSPFTVFLAVLSYFLFAALVIYIQQNPFPGFAGYINIAIVTLVYALEAFAVYNLLYGRKFNPFETHARHVHQIGLGVKACIYACIICVVFISLNFALMLLDLRSWKPFATSLCLVTSAILCFIGFTAPPRQPGGDGGSGSDRVSPGLDQPPGLATPPIAKR